MPVIGFLNSASAESFAPFVMAFRQGLSETGHIEGRNVAVEYRWADEQYDRLPALAADLVHHRADVIAANQISAEAAKAATGTIPIIFTTALDPVQLGLVAALNRPGGNLTGVTTLNVELLPKRIELLHQLMPRPRLRLRSSSTRPIPVPGPYPGRARRGTLTWAPAAGPGSKQRKRFRTGFLDPGSNARGRTRDRARSILCRSGSARLAALALRQAVPTVFEFRQFVAAGGLMSYGGSLTDVYRLGGRLCRADSQGREAGRPAGPSVNRKSSW